MSLSKLFRPRILISVSLILVLAVLAFAYAAANVVDESGAGDGDGVVSGYTITDIEYTLASDPTELASVGFNVNPTSGAGAAGDVRITNNPLDATPTWVVCVGDNTAPAWICTFGAGALVADIDTMRVVAVQ